MRVIERTIVNKDVLHLDYFRTIVEGDFVCSVAKGLTSLRGSPTETKGVYDCSNLKLKSLRGGPRKVGRSFVCDSNKLKSLYGCPRDIGTNLYCEYNPMTTLKNIHRYIDRIGDTLYLPISIRYNILGLLKIRDLRGVYTDPTVIAYRLNDALDIINKYLDHKPNPNDRDIHACQIELIESGFSNFARL